MVSLRCFYFPTTLLCICLAIVLFIYLFIYLSIRLFIYLFIYLFICTSLFTITSKKANVKYDKLLMTDL